MLARQKFDAWGNLRTDNTITGTMPTDVAFTGQRENLEIGLHFFNARFYSPYKIAERGNVCGKLPSIYAWPYYLSLYM